MAEEDKDVDMSSDDSDDEQEKKNEEQLSAHNAELLQNPYNYQAHVDKIELLKTMGELDKLREARESFSKLYPLTAQLWLNWLRDEQGLAASAEEKEEVFSLFERAVLDYVDPELWLEYCQFSLCGLGSEEGIKKAREVFEKALATVGIHMSKGALIWEAYREFEGALLGIMSGDGYTEENRAAQKAKIEKIFQRQLTVPLLNMETTLEEYKAWLSGEPDKSVVAKYKEAQKMMELREGFENALLRTEGKPEQLEKYQEYLDFELKSKNPVRIQCLFERRVTDHCLVPKVWGDYLDYLEKNLNIDTVILGVFGRATRNCTWSGDLWCGYLRALERFEKEEKEVVKVFEDSVKSGLGDNNDYVNVWLSFIDFKRRKMKYDDYEEEEEKEREKECESMRKVFNQALEHLAGLGADPDCKIARYWASMEGDRFRDMEKTRNIWSDIVQGPAGDRAQMWMEYCGLEKLYGDTKHLRKLFGRALQRTKDVPELIGETWVQFEREEGTLEQFEKAVAEYKAKMVKTVADRAKNSEAAEDEAKRKQEKVEKKKEKDKEHRRNKRHEMAEQKREGRKRKADDGFKVPSLPEGSPSAKVNKKETVAPPPGFKKESVAPPPGFVKPSVAPPPGFKPEGDGFKKPVAPPPGFKGDVAPPPGFKADEHQSGGGGNNNDDDAKTVFVSNLSYSATEEDLKAALGSSGEIKEVRLVKKPNGQSKGFAYVVFESADQARKAIARDKEPLKDRPMFISECNPNKKGHDFKYGTGLERNKLFIQGLPLTVTKESLARLFAEHGKLKDVRLVTYRNGSPKGIAFVEYEEASSASTAVFKANGLKVEGKEISVALSNPPARKQQQQSQFNQEQQVSLGQGARDQSAGGARGKGRVQVAFVPRSVKAKTGASAGASGNGASEGPPKNGSSNEDKKAKSNADFRAMLLGKK